MFLNVSLWAHSCLVLPVKFCQWQVMEEKTHDEQKELEDVSLTDDMIYNVMQIITTSYIFKRSLAKHWFAWASCPKYNLEAL